MVKGKKRVLVVDDEPAILRILRINLRLSGYDVITTISGEEALHLVESQQPDIMLLDLLMTPMSGLDVLKKLRTFSQVPVIVLTGRGDKAAVAFREGANDVLVKPFKPEELTKKIRTLLKEPKLTPAGQDKSNHE
jgi:two-component system KDP operon response regulator KdpE